MYRAYREVYNAPGFFSSPVTRHLVFQILVIMSLSIVEGVEGWRKENRDPERMWCRVLWFEELIGVHVRRLVGITILDRQFTKDWDPYWPVSSRALEGKKVGCGQRAKIASFPCQSNVLLKSVLVKILFIKELSRPQAPINSAAWEWIET
jgi:hypothetical protein